jgi:ubiquinone/menaquinone biosynthesis C-methylase UbiE
MINPWLQIPAQDYEGHMASTDVGQLQVLNDLMAHIFAKFSPKTLAVFGCSTGNGFEHISPSKTERIVGIDINPDYLDVVRNRFEKRLPNLELIECDFTSSSFHIEPVSMIIAALVFEYVNIERALLNMSKCLVPGGNFIAALQLPSPDAPSVTKTQYTSLESLTSIMKLVDVDAFTESCFQRGLFRVGMRHISMKHGKALYIGHYRKPEQTN